MTMSARQIRTLHPYGYRSGQWAELLSETEHVRGSRVYVVRFPDGASDFWVIDDPEAQYEMRDVAAA